jgi:integrase
MTTLRHQAAEYVALRRALGFKLVDTERLLMQFITHLEQIGAMRITTDVAVAWARQTVRAKPFYLRRRLGVVRQFARHLHTLDPATEVPPAGMLRCSPNRMPPHLYSADEIDALLHAVSVLFRHPLRVATYRTLIGLLAVTGMRIGEVVRLDRDHVDLESGILTIVGASRWP